MEPKQQAIRNKQRERQQRGDDFQKEIKESWRRVPNIWRLRLKDGRGGSNAADEITIAQDVNILAELKRTNGQAFELGMLRPNQLQGLIDFDQVIERNYGLVYISFHNVSKKLDKAYAFRLTTALQYMKKHQRKHIKLEEFERGNIPAIELPRLKAARPLYDLQGVVECYKFL